MAVRRIQKDLKDLEKSGCGVSIEVTNDNLEKLKGKISGPPGTPYEGGEFILDIQVPPGYPFKPVTAKFVTKIWHPNIGAVSGDICLDVLRDAWTPSMTLRVVLLSIQALLQDPEPDSAINGRASRQYKNDPEMYKLTAGYWAQVFARAPGSNKYFDDKVKLLKDRGVYEEKALDLLSTFSWNLEDLERFIARTSV